MQAHRLIASLALPLLPLFASAQTTIFSSNFSSGERVTNNANYDVGDWTLASTKAITGVSYATGAFAYGMNATTSGFVETQNRYTATPTTISAVGEWIELKVKFTNTNNLLAGGTSSSINIGLYDTAGNNPTAGLESGSGTATLSATNSSPFSTGNAQLWEGYVGKIAPNTAANSVFTRPVQVSDGTESSSENQELLFNNVGGGAFDYPVGVNVGTTATSTLGALSGATQYNAVLRITVTAASEYTLSYSLLNSTGDTTLQSISRTATGGTFINGLSVDGLAFGYRQSGTSLATAITLNEVSVTLNTVPEPSSYAALAGLAGLAAVGLRRRRKA